MTKPYMEALVEALGDEKLTRAIDTIQQAREELHEANEEYEQREPDGARESRSIDRETARYINRKYG